MTCEDYNENIQDSMRKWQVKQEENMRSNGCSIKRERERQDRERDKAVAGTVMSAAALQISICRKKA